MPPRRFLSRFAAVFVIAIAISQGPAAAAGPWRNLGPEGHASFVGELRFLAGEDSRHQTRLFRSSDGDRIFSPLLSAGGVAATFRQSPVNPSQLAFLSASGLYLSLDRGSSWTSETLEAFSCGG